MLRIPEFENHLLFIPLGLSVAIFLTGIVFRHNGPRLDAPIPPLIFVEVLFWMEIALGVAFIYSAKGRRLSVSAIILSLWLFALFCESVAAMSLTNVWL